MASGEKVSAHHVGYAPADAGNEDDATAVPEAGHLPPSRLRGIQYAADVDVHGLTRVASSRCSNSSDREGRDTYVLEHLGWVIKAVVIGLDDARRGDAHIHTAFFVTDGLADLPQSLLRRKTDKSP